MGKIVAVFFTVIIASFLLVNPAFSLDEASLAKPQTAVQSMVKQAAKETPSSGTDKVEAMEQPPAEGLSFNLEGPIVKAPAAKTPELKKIDINKIGASAYYETYEGLRLLKYFTVAQRVEIYQEPRPVDAYIMDAKKIRWLHWNMPWNEKVRYREQIQPIFTRAYGTEITMSDPKDKEGQWRYTHDYRQIYHNQFPVYQMNPQANRRDIIYTWNTNYKAEEWDQNEILMMHSKHIDGIEWDYTSNLGYRYSTMDAKNTENTHSYYENRHTLFCSLSLVPNQRFETFSQLEYFKSRRPKSTFPYSPDHWFMAQELRMRSKDLRTSFIPRISYSQDRYYPTRNKFHKTEMQLRWGHDWNEKLNGSFTYRYVLAMRNEVDNKAPTYLVENAVNDMAAWTGFESRGQYNVYDRLWIQGGLDYSVGTNMSDFDNLGLLAGLEYYAPGMIRVDVGWRGNQYYNIDDYMSSVYFKVYFFM
ncbi:MAG: hypothetical protein WC592_05265 [Candidatus Omnitrophota bacterium]